MAHSLSPSIPIWIYVAWSVIAVQKLCTHVISSWSEELALYLSCPYKTPPTSSSVHRPSLCVSLNDIMINDRSPISIRYPFIGALGWRFLLCGRRPGQEDSYMVRKRRREEAIRRQQVLWSDMCLRKRRRPGEGIILSTTSAMVIVREEWIQPVSISDSPRN